MKKYPKDPWHPAYITYIYHQFKGQNVGKYYHVFSREGYFYTRATGARWCPFVLVAAPWSSRERRFIVQKWLVVKCWKSCNKQRVVWVRWWKPSQPKQRIAKVQNGSKRLRNTYFQRASGCVFSFFWDDLTLWEGEKKQSDEFAFEVENVENGSPY